MKKRNKKILLSFIVSTAILISSQRFFSRFSYHTTYTNNYTSFDFDLCDDSIIEQYDIGELNTFVPQGICVLEDCYLVSLYDSVSRENSVIYVISFNGEFIHKTKLDIKAHVGGIAYDRVHNLLWVASNDGCICSYEIDDVLKNDYVESLHRNIFVGDHLINYKNDVAVSFMGMHNDNLIVGAYTLLNEGVMKEYKISFEDNNCCLELISSSSIPDKVQGVAFYENNGSEYILFSRSYGKYNNSVLDICSYNPSIKKYNDSTVCHTIYEMEPMMEQLVVNDNGNLVMVHENRAFIYCPNCNLSDIYISDLNILLNLKK